MTFRWTSQPNVRYYGLYVSHSPPQQACPAGGWCDATNGDAFATSEIALMPTGLNTSYTVDNIPADGRKIYVRLFTKFDPESGPYRWRDYIYTAAAS